MCERYVLPEQLAAEREFTPGKAWWKFDLRFNVAEGQYVPAIRLHDRQSEAIMMRWGLIPEWAEGRVVGEEATSLDIDQLEVSPFFRGAWFNAQRCIMPIAGFYAWQPTNRGYRQPYFVGLNNRSVCGVAAIWDRSVNKDDDDVIEGCAMVHVPANELLTQINTAERRMPAILMRRDYDTWLRGSTLKAKGVLKPYKAEWMHAHAVSPRVNSTAADGVELIRAC